VTEWKTRSEGWPPHRVTGVDVWPFRTLEGRSEFLLLHRSGLDGAPFWQGVSGWIEVGEAPHVTALRELHEETGLAAVEIYTVNSVFDLYAWKRGSVEAIVPFAVLVPSEATPQLSDEHDEWRWASPPEALALVPYEPQRAAIRRISADLLDRPSLAHLYRVILSSEGTEKSR
jgi:8-oxo-dGTP pyrophosphatase MutT (NUDIX family)